jgi:hypothetical protein
MPAPSLGGVRIPHLAKRARDPSLYYADGKLAPSLGGHTTLSKKGEEPIALWKLYFINCLLTYDWLFLVTPVNSYAINSK